MVNFVFVISERSLFAMERSPTLFMDGILCVDRVNRCVGRGSRAVGSKPGGTMMGGGGGGGGGAGAGPIGPSTVFSLKMRGLPFTACESDIMEVRG